MGARSARVRSFQNVDIIVPNSSFLERNVINWTLADDQYRTYVAVGVVYGSSTREVTKLIRKAVDEHGRILKKPEPFVLLRKFGDNSLDFEVHFWIRMAKLTNRLIIESDVRYRIDTLFREAGIVIAFPQRDVHLDANGPLDVRLLRERRFQPDSESRIDSGDDAAR
jgi:small-conductance mechanosensitive channel